MKENWLEIFDILSSCINNKVTESTYQKEIENCFKILGWRKTNKTLQSQMTIPIGNNNYIRPDIILQKENEKGNIIPIIAVEIKRPDNIKSERQELQLFSYMRQLRLSFGLYIGEKIQLFYDAMDKKENPIASPISVLTVDITDTDDNGEIFCELFSYDQCNSEKIESYCKESLKREQEYIRLQDRISDFMLHAEKNIKELIKNRLVSEGFTGECIDKELSRIDILANRKISEIKMPQTIQHSVNITSKQIPNSCNSQTRDTTKFSFDGGITYYNKRKFVLEIIKDYIHTHSKITFDELERVFYPEIHSKSRGVIKRYTDVQQMIEKSQDTKKRYFLDKSDIISLSDGTRIVVNNQWGDKFSNFLSAIKDIYTVESDSDYNI